MPGMIYSPWTLLWHVPDFPDDQSVAVGLLASWHLGQYNSYYNMHALLQSQNTAADSETT